MRRDRDKDTRSDILRKEGRSLVCFCSKERKGECGTWDGTWFVKALIRNDKKGQKMMGTGDSAFSFFCFFWLTDEGVEDGREKERVGNFFFFSS